MTSADRAGNDVYRQRQTPSTASVRRLFMRELSDYDPIWTGTNGHWQLIKAASASNGKPNAQALPDNDAPPPSVPAAGIRVVNQLTGETFAFDSAEEQVAAVTYLIGHGMVPVDEAPPLAPAPALPIVPAVNNPPLPIRGIVFTIAIIFLVIALFAVLRLGPFTEQPWNRQFGSVGDDRADVCAVSRSGDVYVAGTTDGDLFGSNTGGDDVWIAKFDSNANMVWARHLGSTQDDTITGIAIDPSGNIVVAGGTEGDLFAKNGGAVDDEHPHHDIFMLKLNSYGKILWGRQFPSKGDEIAKAVGTTASGAILVAGDTDHQIFVRGNGGHTVPGSSDIFLAKFEPNGTNDWAVQFGGAIPTYADTLALDAGGNCYVAGRTAETVDGRTSVPTAYIARFDATGRINWSAQAPSGDNSFPASVVTDSAGNAYMAADMMFGPAPLHQDPGVVEMNSKGQMMRRVEFKPLPTFQVSAATPDKRGGAILAGASTDSLSAENRGNYDAIVCRYGPDGRLLWGDQVGSPGNDILTGVTFGQRGVSYTFGKTDGDLFHENSGGDDAILLKIDRGGHIADRGYWGEVAPRPPKKPGTTSTPDPSDM